MKINRTENVLEWVKLMSKSKPRWYRPWHRGYVQAMKDIQLILSNDFAVDIISLNEYRATEGLLEREED
jgi:hypothetical protein